MAPVRTFVAALATIVAASGVSLPSVAAATAGDHSLRGGRKLQEGLCNSIGCPDGYTPITDAMNVECDDDPCEISQCCEAFCSYHPCPNNFIPISGAGTTLCPDSGCTDDLCCVDGVDMGPPATSSPTFPATTDDFYANDDC